MKTHLLTLVWFLFIGSAFSQNHITSEAPQPSPAARLEIEAIQPSKSASKLKLSFKISNLSTTNALHFYQTMPPADNSSRGIKLTIISPTGKNISTQRAGSFSGTFIVVSPGMTNKFEVPIGELYAFDAPGIYKITAQKTVYVAKSSSKLELVSNTLSVNIPPQSTENTETDTKRKSF